MRHPDIIEKSKESDGGSRLFWDHGFTMTEIVVVIIITGALASLALPRMTGTLERARAAEGVQMLTAYIKAQEIYKAEHGDYLTLFGGADNFLDINVLNSSYFKPTRLATGYMDPGPIFWIWRKNAYFLGMAADGTVTCEEFSNPEPPGLPLAPMDFTCAQAGF